MHPLVFRGDIDEQRRHRLDLGGVPEAADVQRPEAVDALRQAGDGVLGVGVVAEDEGVPLELVVEVRQAPGRL